MPALSAGMTAYETDKTMKKPRDLSTTGKILGYFYLTLVTLFAVWPVLQVISISLRPGDRLLSKSLRIIPEGASLDTYVRLFTKEPFLRWMWNSILVSAVVTVIGAGLAATAGYAFSRYKFKGRGAAMLGLITTQMFPATMLLLPLFILLIKIHAYDNYLGPDHRLLRDRASIHHLADEGILRHHPLQPRGSGHHRRMLARSACSGESCSRSPRPRSSSTPCSRSWPPGREYLVAAVIIQDQRMFTLPLGLKMFQSNMEVAWGLYSAGAVIVSIPVVLLFLFLSRWLVSGLTLGSVKG